MFRRLVARQWVVLVHSSSVRIHSISMERQSLLSRWPRITTCSRTEYQPFSMDRCVNKASFNRYQPELYRWLWCKVRWKIATRLFFKWPLILSLNIKETCCKIGRTWLRCDMPIDVAMIQLHFINPVLKSNFFNYQKLINKKLIYISVILLI